LLIYFLRKFLNFPDRIGEWRSLDDQLRLCIENQNEQAKKYSAMLAHLVRVVCVFGKLGLAVFSGQEKSILPPTEEITGGAEVAGK
jgi:hypothetical protein